MEKLLVMDVAKVTLVDKATKKITATASVTTSSITATLSEEHLRAGWGGGIVATINSERNIELNFTDVFFSLDYLAITAGTEVEAGATGEVLDSFVAVVADNGGSLEVAMPTGVTVPEAVFVDVDGDQEPVTVTGSAFPLPDGATAVEGDEVTVYYKKTITGQKVTIDAQKFPKFMEIQYHTRAFDPETNVVTKDLYIQFDKVKPSGDFNLDLQVSSAASTELKFTAMNKDANSTEMGRYFAVDRVEVTTP